MGIVAEHGDAVIAAAAALLGVFSRAPLDVLHRRATERHERDTWLRDRRVAAAADVSMSARAVRQAYEARYETYRTGDRSHGRYEPDPAVEAAFTAFTRAADVADFVADTTDDSMDDLHTAVKRLVHDTRRAQYEDRHGARAQFDAAMGAFIEAVRSRLR